jgi:DNA modification methylase
MYGAGINMQQAHISIFVGVSFKFRQFIQAIHRTYRFLQDKQVEAHVIYCESEREVLKILMDKWGRHKEQVTKMSEIIKEYGLSELALAQALTRSFGCERVEVSGEGWQLVNNDSIEEAHQEAERIQENSIGLILTSVPFSTQYEYSPSYNDFGNSKSNAHFFEQMDFLTPQLYRALQPGRIAAIHVKDRTVPGGMTGMGFQEAYPFHADCIFHFIKHGFRYLGMKTIVTDVVRENNQTYRLGWTEQCKDGTKMGYGMPEYLLLFRKPQTDRTKGYADIPVRKDKKRYSKARWQVDAHAFTRSNGNRFITPEEIADMPLAKDFHQKVFGIFHDYSLANIYDFEQHVKIGEALERRGVLPVTFMLLQPPSWHPDVWTDITRMLTVNAIQASKGKGKHICPMQFDIADRVIVQMSNPGDVVLDPFSGLGTVPYRAVALGRKAIGIELNHQYFLDSAAYCKAAESKMQMPSLFDLIGEPEEPEAPKLPEYFHKLTKKAQAEWKRENGHAAQL